MFPVLLDETHVSVSMSLREYELLRNFAKEYNQKASEAFPCWLDYFKTLEGDDFKIADMLSSLEHLPDYGALLISEANDIARSMGYENLEDMEKNLPELPDEIPEQIDEMYRKIVDRLKREHLWVEDK